MDDHAFAVMAFVLSTVGIIVLALREIIIIIQARRKNESEEEKAKSEAHAAEAHASDEISAAWERLNKPLIDELEKLRLARQEDKHRMDRMEEVLREWMVGIRILINQIETHRINGIPEKPEWIPMGWPLIDFIPPAD
jgi:hypothetical protein